MPTATLRHVLRHLHTLSRARGGEDLTDGELLERFRGGREEAAFSLLVQRHGPMVLGVCRRLLADAHAAEDAFQATFLVLVRKAASIRRQDSVASWLYGVARRVAGKARLRAPRAAALDEEPRAMNCPEPRDEVSWAELRAVLDEELGRLPEKYRAPLVLCGLEGKTHEQAARELRCPKSSLSSRLVRGRELLRQRLVQRGISLSAVALAAVLARQGSAAVPALLALATVRAAVQVAAAGVAGLPAALVSLTEEGVRSVSPGKARAGLALLLAAGIGVAGTAVFAHQARQPQQPGVEPETPAPVADKPSAPPADLYGDPLPPGALVRLGTLRMRHHANTACATFTQDSKTVIVGDMMGYVVFWDVATGKELRRFRPDAGTIHALALTPDGKTLAAGGWGTVSLWDVASGAALGKWEVAKDAVMDLAFAPDGKTAALRYQGKEIELWDVGAGKRLHTLQGHLGNITSLAFDPDGKTLASSSWGDPTVRLWDVATGKQVRTVAGDQGEVLTVAFAPDGKTLATGGNRQRIRFWDPGTGKLLREGDPVSGFSCQGLHYLPGGKVLVGLWNLKVIAWDAATGKQIWEGEGDHRNMGRLAVSPDGKVLATSWGGPHSFDLWDAATGKLLHPFVGHRERVTGLAFAADGRTLFSGAGPTGEPLNEWDLATGKRLRRLGKHPAGACDLALAPDGRHLVAADFNSTVCLWDLTTGQEARRFKGHTSVIVSVSLSADGKTLATGSYYDKTLRVWDVATGEARHVIPLNQDWPCAAVLSPDGAVVASGGFRDGTLRLWDTATGKERTSWTTPHQPAYSVAFAPDGRTLATGGLGGPVCLWDAAGKLLRQFDGKWQWVARVAFSADGRTLAVGAGDHTVSLWEVATGKERGRFTGHQGAVHSLAFSPDDRRLASGSDDTTVLVWDVAGRPLDKSAADLWADLAGDDAAQAYRAIWSLAAAPGPAARLIGEKVKPAAAPPKELGEQLVRLLADLDSDQFAVREKADAGLRQLGGPAEPLLRQALKKELSPEARRRVQRAVARLEQEAAAARVEQGRALEVLEHLDTPEARRLLEALAAGAADAWLTEEAKAALRRLGKHAAAR